MQVLTIGGATLDLFIQYYGADTMEITKQYGKQCYTIFESGEKIEVDEIIRFTGGGATNTAESFARMGYQTSCVCKVGNDDTSQILIRELEQSTINTAYIIRDDTYATGTSFIINAQSGERTIFAHRGANSYLNPDDIPIDAIQNTDLLYITSLSNKSSLILHNIVTHAKNSNTPIAINPGISQLRNGTLALKESLAGIDTLILNSAEARIFMLALIEVDSYYQKTLGSMRKDASCPCDSTRPMPRLLQETIEHENLFLSTRNFFKEIFNLGTKTVVITDGCYGVYVATPQEILFHPSLHCNVIDTVGAGDAFGSCFVASLHAGDSHDVALRHGMVNSASVIGSIGAKTGLLTRAQVLERSISVQEKIIRYQL